MIFLDLPSKVISEKMMQKLVFTLGCLLISTFSKGQYSFEQQSKRAQTFFEQAESLSRQYRFQEADSLYLLAINAAPKFLQAVWFRGNLNLEQLQQYDVAIFCFNYLIEKSAGYQPDAWLKLGLAKMYKQDFAGAREAFSQYRNLPSISLRQSQEAERFLKSCDFAEQAVRSPVRFAPKNMGKGVNTTLDELMPTITGDERFVYYTRNEPAGQMLDENIYSSEFTQGRWEESRLVERPISTWDYMEGATGISPNGKYLFFTSCGRPDGVGDCDIYFSVKTPTGWDRPKNLGQPINTPGWDIQPSISPDNRTLYFASRRPGGYGGLDIWKSTLNENAQWGQPINLGPNVNTVYDEERPFIHPDGETLYFSSDGLPGMGRSDFFLVRFDEKGNAGIPQNLGWPLNTPGDEIGICISPNGRNGYMASERPDGFGGMDLYTFETDENYRPVFVTYVKGIITDAISGQPVKAQIRITDLTTGKLLSSIISDAQTGQYMTTLPVGHDYALSVTAENYLFYSHHFSLAEMTSSQPYAIDIKLKKIHAGQTVVLTNVFFETDRFELKEESKSELQVLLSLLEKNASLEVEIGGHTDASGSKEKNSMLSENRAKSVANYLIEKGISATRLSWRGYGDSLPIASNDTEEGKAKNRRTEFKVVNK